MNHASGIANNATPCDNPRAPLPSQVKKEILSHLPEESDLTHVVASWMTAERAETRSPLTSSASLSTYAHITSISTFVSTSPNRKPIAPVRSGYTLRIQNLHRKISLRIHPVNQPMPAYLIHTANNKGYNAPLGIQWEILP